MKKTNKILISLISLGFFSIFVVYCSYLFVLPKILNSKTIENIINKSTNQNFSLTGFIVKTNPDLTTEIFIKSLDSKFIKINKAKIKIKKLKISNAEADYIFADLNKASFKKSNSEFKISKLNNLPPIQVKKIELIFQKNKFKIENLKISKNISFLCHISSPFLNKKVFIKTNSKNEKNKIKIENTTLFLDDEKIELSGYFVDKNDYKISVFGENLPVYDIEKSLLFYQKSQDPAKKFIENFKNFKGTINIDLKINNNGIFGKAKALNLKADAVWFDIPLYFREFVLDFDGHTITSNARGKSGKEDIFHTLLITNLGSKDKKVEGKFSAILDKNFYYVPELRILGKINASVEYIILKGKNTINYTINLEKNSDLLYQNLYLGLRSEKRRFFVNTLKDCKDLHIKKLDYSLIKNEKIENIITGNGLLIKKQEKYQPQYINIKTNGFAPVSFLGSFGEYVDGGYFRGNVRYDFKKDLFTGNFEVIETEINDFYVKQAKVISNPKTASISAIGTYKQEDFSCNLILESNFKEKITIQKMDLYLDKFKIRRNNSKKRKKLKIEDIQQKTSKIKNIEIDINDWKITVKKISMGKIQLENIVLNGNLTNSIFNFKTNEVSFAKGILLANGKYNFNDSSSNICFNASNIDSNIASYLLFNLKNQIQGFANANLHLITTDNLENIKAKLTFEIENGFLPQLGNMEFMFTKFNKNKKFKLSSLTNADISKAENLNSDIKGTLFLDNEKLKDIEITSSQKHLGLFFDGSYNIRKQDASVELFGKYNKQAPKGIKILSIPLNWILNFVFRDEVKIAPYRNQTNKIPKLENQNPSEEKYFKIDVKGNLNTKQVDVDIKGLK